MSCSKPLQPFVFDLLCCLNRSQLERFSIVCRALKNLIQRYFHSKPYRVIDFLCIHGGEEGTLLGLAHKRAEWHPNKVDYAVEEFLGIGLLHINHDKKVDRQKLTGQKYKADDLNVNVFYSFAEMRPYLGPTVRVRQMQIRVSEKSYGDTIYTPQHIAEIESISFLWRDSHVFLSFSKTATEKDMEPILNSPAILQCQELMMPNSHFSFKDYPVLYATQRIDAFYTPHRLDDQHDFQVVEEIDLNYWQQFLEQPGAKPVLILRWVDDDSVLTFLDQLFVAFSAAITPNPFKIIFAQHDEIHFLHEFKETNEITGEIFQMKKGLPIGNYHKTLLQWDNYTLERSCV